MTNQSKTKNINQTEDSFVNKELLPSFKENNRGPSNSTGGAATLREKPYSNPE